MSENTKMGIFILCAIVLLMLFLPIIMLLDYSYLWLHCQLYNGNTDAFNCTRLKP